MTTTEHEIDVEYERPPFEMLPTAMFFHGEDAEHVVSHGAAICYAVLAKFGADRNFRISQRKIANGMGRSVRAVSGYVAELREKGWVLVRPVYTAKGRAASHYLVLSKPIAGPDDPRWVRHQARLADGE